MTEAKRARVGADSARRVLDVLFAFSEGSPTASVREIADTAQVPLPSAHRYVALLRDVGLVAEGDRGRYHLTSRVAALGRAARAANTVVDVAEPFLRALVDQIEETVLLVRIVHGRPVCVHRVEASRRMRLSFEPGQSLPPLRGASAKILVGSLPDADRAGYLRRVVADDPGLAGATEEFSRAATKAAARGWATSTQEIDDGVWAAAALIHEAGRPVAALSAACASFRLDDDRKVDVVTHVRATAESISAALTG